jgi:hypothetical protein
MAVIEVRGLTKRFGPVLAVDRLSFDVDLGTVVGFLGPNGAGKTTTLRVLLGLVRPTGGTATISGKAYTDLPDPLRHVGAVLEASSFYPGRRARDHLRVQAMAGGFDPARADEVLELVGLQADGTRRVGGFSGRGVGGHGGKRRVPSRHGHRHLPGHPGPGPCPARQGHGRGGGRLDVRPRRRRAFDGNYPGVRGRQGLPGGAGLGNHRPFWGWSDPRVGAARRGRVGLGSLFRSQIAAIVTVFAWGLVVEQVIGGLFDAAQPYLPYTAATTMAGATLGGGTGPLPFAAAGALVAGVAALVSAVAAWTTVQADVS